MYSGFQRGALALAMAALAAGSAFAKDRSGADVVGQTCAACHATGKNGAPKIGDFADWTQRASGGFDKLADHAIAGKGKMPAHGGQATLSDLEMSRAITYMATGGRAADPSKPLSQTKTMDADLLVNSHCVKCHGTGLNGAPRIKEFADWKPRIQNGLDALVESASNGHNKMPARAGFPSLSDSDLRGAIVYMIIPTTATK